jgi:hypothetical protein
MRDVVIALLVLVSFASPPPAHSLAANEIYEQLIGPGVTLNPDETVRLPQPVLADGLSGAAQRQAIESLLAGRYEWDEFARKSVVSPLLLKINDTAREAGQIGRRVDLYFVAYGTLDVLRDDRKLQDQLNQATAGDMEGENGSVKVLSADELAERGLPSSQGASDPRWIAVEATLLGKVQLNFTTRIRKTDGDQSLIIASLQDDKFQGDATYPNCWRSITIDDAGRRQVGPPQPYAGLGSYVKATRLAEPEGAAFIEYHVVFAEPEGWFHGANLLRSKLPIVAQDLVRKLRRKMAEE